MRTWIAAICKQRKAKGSGDQGIGESGNQQLSRSCFSPSPFLRFSVSPFPKHGQSLTPTGFTLLELSVVLFIIGLLVAIAVPMLGDLSGARLESSARRLAALVRYLSEEAAFRGQLYRLHYDLDRQTYWVSILAASEEVAEFVADPDPLSRPVQLPRTITFADVRVPGLGRVSAGQVYTHFYPQGYTDPTVVHLRDQHARVMTVTIPPLSGEVGVYEGYVDGLLRHTSPTQ